MMMLDADEDATPEAVGAVAESGPGCEYTVRAGDNPFRIAVNNNITLAELQSANSAIAGINPVIQPGQVLVIPGCGRGTDVDEPEDSETATPEPTETAEPTATDEPAPDGFIRYEAVRGDTLSSIARRFDTTLAVLVETNNIVNPDSLAVGDVLLIPDNTATEAVEDDDAEASATPAASGLPATSTPTPVGN
jgi:LysM repeat protein